MDRSVNLKIKKLNLVAISLAILFILAAIAAVAFRARGYAVVNPKRGEITEAVYGLGKVKSNQRYEVIVGVVSTVKKRFVNEGDQVEKGKQLIELEDNAIFRAPFSGAITLAAVYPGETALPHVPILRMESLSERYIELSLEQQAAIRVKVGQAAKISFESLRGKVLRGRVSSLYPRENEFIARISVDSLEENILPGMTADVSVEIGKINNALLVPAKALQNGLVLVKTNGKWEKRKVEIGHIDGLNAEVLGNSLSPSDEIRIKEEN